MTVKNVVLLHGLLRTNLSMAYLGHNLKRKGYNLLNFGYPSRKSPIEEHSEKLREFLAERVEEGAELNFVSHSLGSLIVRNFANDFCHHYKLKRAVMLGPPNQGSEYAVGWSKVPGVKKFLGPAFNQICDLSLSNPSDKLEIGIIAGGTKGGRGMMPLLSSNNDGVVTTEEAALEGAKDLVIIWGWHSLLMYQPAVISQVLYFLEHGIFKKLATTT